MLTFLLWSCLWFYDVLCIYIYVYNVGESAIETSVFDVPTISPSQVEFWSSDSCRRRWICAFFDSLTFQIKPRQLERDGCLMQVMKVMKNYWILKFNFRLETCGWPNLMLASLRTKSRTHPSTTAFSIEDMAQNKTWVPSVLQLNCLKAVDIHVNPPLLSIHIGSCLASFLATCRDFVKSCQCHCVLMWTTPLTHYFWYTQTEKLHILSSYFVTSWLYKAAHVLSKAAARIGFHTQTCQPFERVTASSCFLHQV